jgi:ketosteroid isomerase-like protein
MSQENVEVVRQPIAVRAQSRRHLDERLSRRFPRLLALVARAVWRLPPRSRLRQALVRRAVQLGFEATNRADHEVALALYHPDGETTFPPQIATVGTESVTRGREERVRFQREWIAEWGEFRFEPEEIIDLGDRLLVVGHVRGSGLSSGAGFDNQWAVLYTVSGGRALGEQVFLDHGDALEAAGLRE